MGKMKTSTDNLCLFRGRTTIQPPAPMQRLGVFSSGRTGEASRKRRAKPHPILLLEPVNASEYGRIPAELDAAYRSRAWRHQSHWVSQRRARLEVVAVGNGCPRATRFLSSSLEASYCQMLSPDSARSSQRRKNFQIAPPAATLCRAPWPTGPAKLVPS